MPPDEKFLDSDEGTFPCVEITGLTSWEADTENPPEAGEFPDTKSSLATLEQ
jgi:hypothetical protein